MRASKFYHKDVMVEVDYECADEDHALEPGQYTFVSVKLDGIERIDELTSIDEAMITRELDNVYAELAEELKLEYA